MTSKLPSPEDRLPALLEGRFQKPTTVAEREILEITAALLLADSPAMKAPMGTWDAIQSRLPLRGTAPVVPFSHRCLQWGGWAAAACLGVAFWLQKAPISARGDFSTASGRSATSRDGSTSPAGQNFHSETSSPDHSPGGAALPGGLAAKLSRGVKEYHVLQAASDKALQQEIRALRTAHESRFADRPGMARIVVMEMTGATKFEGAPAPTTAGGKAPISSEKLGDIVAAGLGVGKTPTEPVKEPAPEPEPKVSEKPTKKPITLRAGDSWDGQFVVPAGEPLPDFGLIALPPGTSIRYGSLPLEDPLWAENFKPVTDRPGAWYDVRSDVIWSPSAEHPGEFIGRRPGAEFNKDSYQFTAPEPTPAETLEENPPPVLKSDNTPKAAAPEGPTSAWTIFDETTGRGSIVVENLPPPPPGQSYQLSFADSLQNRSIPVGVLPDLGNGTGRVYFDLGGPGFSPGTYSLTLTGPGQPVGVPVLTGPENR